MVYILYPDTDVDNKLVKPTLNDAVLKSGIFIITIPDPSDAAVAWLLGISFPSPPTTPQGRCAMEPLGARPGWSGGWPGSPLPSGSVSFR